jgi:hypothetical protein
VQAGVYLVSAVVLLVLGSGLLAAAPRLRMVTVGRGGPVFGVWPLLVVLAVTPAVLAVMLLLVRQRAAALALVAAVGAVAVGRLVLDLWLSVAPWAADRPELWLAAGIDRARAGPGPWLLVAGQSCIVLGGLFAAAEAGRWRGEHAFVAGEHPRVSPLVLPVAVGFAVLAGVGLLGVPFRSADPALVARSVLEVALPASAGGFGLAAGVVLAAGLAASAPDYRVAVGGLAGTSLAVLGVALPRVVAPALAPGLGVAPGPVVGVVGALGLAGVARSISVRAWSGYSAEAELTLPRPRLATGFRVAAGLLCVVSGGCAIVSFFAAPLRLTEALAQPRLPTVGLLLCTGVVLAASGWFTAMHPTGRLVRPALGVVAMAMPMAAAEHITSVLAVIDVPGVDAGVGWWLAVGAVLLALAGALAAVVCGGFERDDVDLSERSFAGPTAPASAAAAVLALPAFLLPLVDGAGRGVTGVFQKPFGLPAWALLAGLLVTVGVAMLGPRCRPVQAAVIYTGGCLLLMLRLARIPFGPRPLPTAGLAEGAWASLLCLLLLLLAATIAVRTGQPDAPRATERPRRAPPIRLQLPPAMGGAPRRPPTRVTEPPRRRLVDRRGTP